MALKGEQIPAVTFTTEPQPLCKVQTLETRRLEMQSCFHNL